MDENVELLEYIYQNAKMGVTSLTELIRIINGKDNKIKKIVEGELKGYENYVKDCERLMKQYNVEAKENSMMANLSSKMGMNFEMLKDNSDAKIADMLIKQDDIKLIKKKDYIKEPKTNGYRSLHLVVEVPVFLSDCTKNMKVEVQIRTIAMDFWASLEHSIRYKKIEDASEYIMNELKNCADTIYETDIRMQRIRGQLWDR